MQKINKIVETELLIISVSKYRVVVELSSFTIGTTEAEPELGALTPSDTATYKEFRNDGHNVKKN